MLVCVCVWETVKQGSSGHLLEAVSFTYSQSHKGRGTQRSEKERNGRERGINLNAAWVGSEGTAWHTHHIYQAGTSEASCSLGPGSKGNLAHSVGMHTKGIFGWFCHSTTLPHKFTKPILSLTKQTRYIKMDHPTNSKRLGDWGQRTILQTHTDALHPALNPSITTELKHFPAWLKLGISPGYQRNFQSLTRRERAAEGESIHHCLQRPSHDGCVCLPLSAGYLDAVTAKEISDGEPLHLLTSPPMPLINITLIYYLHFKVFLHGKLKQARRSLKPSQCFHLQCLQWIIYPSAWCTTVFVSLEEMKLHCFEKINCHFS